MITTLTGKNTFELLARRRHIVTEYVNGYGEFGLETFDAEDVEPRDIHAALTNLPFLVEKKLVVVVNPSVIKELSEKLIDWLALAPDSTDVLLVEPRIDKRTAWYKYLKSNTQLIDCLELDEYALRRWVKDYAEKLGVQIEAGAISELIGLVGLNQQQLSQELDKLSVEGKTINSALVKDLVEPLPKDTVFDMLDALMSGRTTRAFKLYDSLTLRRVSPHEILSMIGWQISTLALIKSAGQPESEISSKTGLHPYVVQKNTSLTRRLTLFNIREVMEMCIDAELAIKRTGLNADKVVNALLMHIAQKVEQL